MLWNEGDTAPAQQGADSKINSVLGGPEGLFLQWAWRSLCLYSPCGFLYLRAAFFFSLEKRFDGIMHTLGWNELNANYGERKRGEENSESCARGMLLLKPHESCTLLCAPLSGQWACPLLDSALALIQRKSTTHRIPCHGTCSPHTPRQSFRSAQYTTPFSIYFQLSLTGSHTPAWGPFSQLPFLRQQERSAKKKSSPQCSCDRSDR